MESELSAGETVEGPGTPAQPATKEPASAQSSAPATGDQGQNDIPTLLIDTVAAVVMKQIKPLLEDLQKIKETGVPLPVAPEKRQVLELPKVQMDLVPGEITLPGNSGVPETDIPRVLIDTVVAVVLKEFGPLLQDLQKIRDQGPAGLAPAGAGSTQVLGDLLGRTGAGGVVDEKTMMAAIKARQEQTELRIQKLQERCDAVRRSAEQRRGR